MYAGVRNADKFGSPLIERLAHHPGALIRPVRSNSHRSNHDLPPFLHTDQRTWYAIADKGSRAKVPDWTANSVTACRGLDQASHNFRYGPWQRSIEFIS